MTEATQPGSPEFLKYHVFRSGRSDYYLTTNPNEKHINDPVGPSYYIRVLAMRGDVPDVPAAEDGPQLPVEHETDGSFSIVVLVHGYDNVPSEKTNIAEGANAQDVYDSRNNSSLVPIMHIRRLEGEGRISVSVIEDGEIVWDTDLVLHTDPYNSGKAKFVFSDPWGRRWSLIGKDNIKCVSYLHEEAISSLERKHIPEAKIGWLTLKSPALKMLDLMIATNMAVHCFWKIETNPSGLVTVATGILSVDSNSAKALQLGKAIGKKKRVGLKFNFLKIASSSAKDVKISTKQAVTVAEKPVSANPVPRSENVKTQEEVFDDNQSNAHQSLSQPVVPVDHVNEDFSQRPRRTGGIKLQRRPKKENQSMQSNMGMESVPIVRSSHDGQQPVSELPNLSGRNDVPAMGRVVPQPISASSRRPSSGAKPDQDHPGSIALQSNIRLSDAAVPRSPPTQTQLNTQIFAAEQQQRPADAQKAHARLSLPALLQLSSRQSHSRDASSNRQSAMNSFQASTYSPINTKASTNTANYGLQNYPSQAKSSYQERPRPPNGAFSAYYAADAEHSSAVMHQIAPSAGNRRVLHKSAASKHRSESMQSFSPIATMPTMATTTSEKKKKNRMSLSALAGKIRQM